MVTILDWLAAVLFCRRATLPLISVFCICCFLFLSQEVFKVLSMKVFFAFGGQRPTTKPVNYFSKYSRRITQVTSLLILCQKKDERLKHSEIIFLFLEFTIFCIPFVYGHCISPFGNSSVSLCLYSACSRYSAPGSPAAAPPSPHARVCDGHLCQETRGEYSATPHLRQHPRWAWTTPGA